MNTTYSRQHIGCGNNTLWHDSNLSLAGPIASLGLCQLFELVHFLLELIDFCLCSRDQPRVTLQITVKTASQQLQIEHVATRWVP